MTRRVNLTEDEKQRICELREQGWKYEAIAAEMKCHVGSVSWHCLLRGASPPNQGSARS
jgi:transcriptional regulator